MISNPTAAASPTLHMRKVDQERKRISSEPRGQKTICVPLDQAEYEAILDAPAAYRTDVDQVYAKHPERFPMAMGGYTLHDKLPYSKKLPDIRLRRLKLKADDEVYTIQPSFVLPYMSGYTDDIGLLCRTRRFPGATSHQC